MWPHSMVTFLLTLNRYLMMDSVIIDMDDPGEFLPKSLEWTTHLDPLLIREFNHFLETSIHWKLERDVPKRNITIYSHASKAYGGRQTFLVKSRYAASVAEVAKASWVQARLADGWSGDFAASKLLDYGGRDKFVIWHRSNREVGGLAPARDFIGYNVRIDCMSPLHHLLETKRSTRALWANPTSQLFTSIDNKEPQISKGSLDSPTSASCSPLCPRTVAILWTNTSSHFDQPPAQGVVRAYHGTSGSYIRAVSLDPPVTSVDTILNADPDKPGFIPDVLFRQFASSKILLLHKKLQSHLRGVAGPKGVQC